MTDVSLIPVKTRILTDKDDVLAVMDEYVKDQIGPDDAVSIAESVLAIIQGRIVRPEDLKPCFLARTLCMFIPEGGSLATPYGMQSLMDVEGKWRVAGAFVAGAVMKALGKPGWFYRLGGEQTALIDDVTCTMPPFDKHIVYGPDKPFEIAREIKRRLGCYGAVVADVNDLKRARIVSHTDGMNPALVSHLLIDNPFGNASQKTPIVIIKNYAKLREQMPVAKSAADN